MTSKRVDAKAKNQETGIGKARPEIRVEAIGGSVLVCRIYGDDEYFLIAKIKGISENTGKGDMRRFIRKQQGTYRVDFYRCESDDYVKDSGSPAKLIETRDIDVGPDSSIVRTIKRYIEDNLFAALKSSENGTLSAFYSNMWRN